MFNVAAWVIVMMGKAGWCSLKGQCFVGFAVYFKDGILEEFIDFFSEVFVQYLCG